MRRPVNSPSIPDGWYSIHPPSEPQTPQTSHVDGLGLTKGVSAANIRVPRLLPSTTTERFPRSPRHRRLQPPQNQQNEHTVYSAADAFAPNRSLRLARLTARSDPPTIQCQVEALKERLREDRGEKERVQQTGKDVVLSARSRAARFRESQASPIVPLHEVVRTFDDAVDASPRAESNQVAVTELFVATWMERFERERGLYKSIVLHAEVAFRELYRLTAKLASPNDVLTAFACKILNDMVDHFGPFSMIVRVLSSEFRQAIYAPPASPSVQLLPYYAIVKNQKRVLISLRKDQMQRQERNDFLRYEIDKVHETLHHFLDQCGLGLVRTIFREWYSVAIVSKRNSKKYIEYFSAWFGGSAKALVPRLFLVWKNLAIETKAAKLHEQLGTDQTKLASVQKQIEELTVQWNLTQLESLAIRNDRKHAEDTIQRLHRKIQSASAFLEDSERREALVAHESQLRVEAMTFLPPLVLESLLRGFHNVGYLQPLHNEFAPSLTVKSEDHRGQRPKTRLSGMVQEPVQEIEESTLAQCVNALDASVIKQGLDDSLNDGDRNASLACEMSLNECLNYVQGIKQRVEGDPTAYLLFLPKTELSGSINQQTAHRAYEGDVDGLVRLEAVPSNNDSPLGLQELVRLFCLALQNVRRQDEHYARHPKLFNSRMLEQSEISVMPHTIVPTHSDPSPPTQQSMLSLVSSHRVLFSSIDSARVASSTYIVRGSEADQDEIDNSIAPASLDQLPLLQTHDLELSPQHTRAFIVLTLGQLLIEYGSLLFSPTDLSAFVRNRLLHKVMLRGIAGGKHTLRNIRVPITMEKEDEEDDNLSDEDSVEDQPLAVPDIEKNGRRGGIPTLGKQTTQRRIQVASRRTSSYQGIHASIANEIDRGLMHLKASYDVWNRLSQQLIQAEIVVARGVLADGTATPSSIPIDLKANISSGSISSIGTGVMSPPTILENDSTPLVALRPRLQVHIEPQPTGPLMASAKEREAPSTPNGTHRRSMAVVASTTEWSYDTAKVRLLSLADSQELLNAVQGLHQVVRTSGQKRAADFTAAKRNLRDVRASQWNHACELASLFSCSTPSVIDVTTVPASEQTVNLAESDDARRHVFECVTFDNEAIERLFSVEDHPDDELGRVQAVLERKKHVVRHALYCKHRPGVNHAASLDDLWHVVKVLRLPRDVRVLPALRDDELLGNSYFHEHFFSPDDVAEVLLQLCNEQFLPQISPLSARVEYFVAHHLPLAMQNQSAIREIMHKLDVKKALSDHGQTLRTIFRRYCAKDKDVLAAVAAKRRAAVVAATATSTVNSVTTATNAAMYAAASSPSPAPIVLSAAPQGITKFMRLADWHEFIADYKLQRARFTAEYATVVFCNVQEAESGSGLEDNLEMIYNEFTEAIVALSVCFFPDPFLRHATRVHQFIRRYLPVSPEETREHHI